MKTVGQILKKTRTEKEIEIQEIARITRIQAKYIEALEKDSYIDLPSTTSTRGFIKNYGAALGLSPDTLLALFRRDFTEDKSGQIIPRGIIKPLSSSKFFWTPQHTIVTSVIVVVLFLMSYLYHEYHLLTGPPKLTIELPKPNSEVRKGQVEIRGEADPESEVKINDEKIKLDSRGKFSYVLSLPEGENTIVFMARNSHGKTNTISRKVEAIP